MKKILFFLGALSLLGNVWVMADKPYPGFESFTAPPRPRTTPTPLPAQSPRKHRAHDRHKNRVLPHLYGMAAFTPTPTVDPSFTATPTPNP